MKAETKVICGIRFRRLSKWSVCDTLAGVVWERLGWPEEPAYGDVRRELMARWMGEVYPGRPGPVKAEVVAAFVGRVLQYHGVEISTPLLLKAHRIV